MRSPAARVRRTPPNASTCLTALAMALRLASSASVSSAIVCSGGSQTDR